MIIPTVLLASTLFTPPSPLQTSCSAPVPELSCGQQTIGTLNGADCHTESFIFFEFWDPVEVPGETVTFRVAAPGHHIVVALQRWSDGTILKVSDSQNSAELTYTMGSTDTILSVGFLAQYDTGDYSISMTCGSSNGGDGDTFLGCPVEAFTTLGHTYNGQLTSADTCIFGDYYADGIVLDLVEGQLYRAEATAGAALYLELHDETTGGAYSMGGVNEDVLFEARTTGPHRVVVSTYNQNVTTTYSVKVEQISTTRCRPVRRP